MEKMVADKIGDVRVADEVIMVIAGLAALEVEGVNFVGKELSKESLPKAGKGVLSKYIGLSKKEEGIEVSLELTLNGQVPIPVISKEVENHVRGAIDSMTGIQVTKVFTKVVGVM